MRDQHRPSTCDSRSPAPRDCPGCARASSRRRRGRPRASPARRAAPCARTTSDRRCCGRRRAARRPDRSASRTTPAPRRRRCPVMSARPNAKPSTSGDGTRVDRQERARWLNASDSSSRAAADGDDQAGDAAGDRQQHALDQRLRDDLPARRADREAHGRLAAARDARARAAGSRRSRRRSTAPARTRRAESAGCVRTAPSSRRRRAPAGTTVDHLLRQALG